MIEQIRQYLRQTPFRPFAIHCSSGDVFVVDHPENAAIVRHTVTVALPDGENAIMISGLHIIGVTGADQIAA